MQLFNCYKVYTIKYLKPQTQLLQDMWKQVDVNVNACVNLCMSPHCYVRDLIPLTLFYGFTIANALKNTRQFIYQSCDINTV